MAVTLRFAPSPTGRIHIGNARTALFNWLLVLREGGRFILRFDDTDAERSRAEYADAIAMDLAWLGIRPAEVHAQSRRLDLYCVASDRLKASGRLYPCYETAEELDQKRLSQRRRGLPPVYDRSALKLTDPQRRELEAAGRRPHWRFLLNHDGKRGEIRWSDFFRGEQGIDLTSLSDPVLVREDGSYLYTLPSVADDVDMGITHIIRGDDHVTNTAVQIELFEALGANPPVFGHHNLLAAADGEALSKRSGAFSVGAFRDAGYEPLAVASVAVRIGTSDAVEPASSLDELAASFDPAKVSHHSAKFDPAEMDAVNARFLHSLPFGDVAPRLAAMGVAGGEPFWLAARANCVKLPDAVAWWKVVTGPLEVPQSDDPLLIEQARILLPAEPWDIETWKSWTAAIKAATGRAGRGLFMPLRRALTGLDHGPELATLLPLIGRSNTLARLAASLPR